MELNMQITLQSLEEYVSNIVNDVDRASGNIMNEPTGLSFNNQPITDRSI